jgi:hypothetical protein
MHLVVAFLAFAAFNLLLRGKATRQVRWLSAAAALLAVAWPSARPFILLLLILLWPFAMLLAWGTTSDRARAAIEREIDRPITRPRALLSGLIAAVAIALLTYRLLVGHHLEQSAGLFIGVPAVLAMIVVLFVSPTSAVGVIFKALTIAILLSALFLWEGVLCIVMASPLLYAVGAIIGAVIDQARRARAETVASCLLFLALMPMSLEDTGVGPAFNRREVVTASRLVSASSDAIATAVESTPRFNRVLPPYLRVGFPRPAHTTIADDQSLWIVRMRGGEMKINGMEPRAGDLVLRVVERTAQTIRWRVESDDSHMTHFLLWREAQVQWQTVNATTTQVTWTLTYDRNLAPAWYFGPWERYATRLAAAYLIDTVATP